MESLLTLPIGDFRAVELAMRLTLALIVMTSLAQLLSLSIATPRLRIPLILSGVSLLGAAWFESGVWLAWNDAFELAGTSYCVTGHLLAGEGRVIAWSLAGPAILVGFGWVSLKPGEILSRRLLLAALSWAILGAFYQIVSLLGFAYCAFQLRGSLMLSLKTQGESNLELLVALASLALALVVTLLGQFHLLPVSRSASDALVRGEIIRSVCDVLSIVVPGVALLILTIRYSGRDLGQMVPQERARPIDSTT